MWVIVAVEKGQNGTKMIWKNCTTRYRNTRVIGAFFSNTTDK